MLSLQVKAQTVTDVIEPITPNGSFTPVRVRIINDGSYICRSDDDRAFMSLPLQREDEYKIVEQKPTEWSEEDFESLVDELVQDIVANEKDAANYGDSKQPTSFFVKKYSDRLKSLRSQSHWKPSEEQMEALWNTLHPDDPYYVDLSSLYNDLKKL